MDIKINDVLKATKDAVKKGKNLIDDAKKSSLINGLKSKIEEHKYNIGKMIYDNGIEVDDGLVLSNINSIDRLVEEIKQMEEKNG